MYNGNTTRRVTEDLRALAREQSPGSRLPAVRELMARHGVGPATVQKALAALSREGLVEARPGRGTFVAARPEPASPADLGWQSVALGETASSFRGLEELMSSPGGEFRGKRVVSLRSGYLPEELQPSKELAAAVSRAARKPGAWGKIPPEGLPELRGWFARESGSSYAAQDVVVTSGGQAALATAFRALTPRGAPVLVESPTYVGALAAIAGEGLRAVPVPTDRDGVVPELLEEVFSATGSRLFYCQPTFANPGGATLPGSRRRRVLEIAQAAGAFVLEDEATRDFFFEDAPPPTLADLDEDGRVVHVRSLTKPIAPGMRLAGLAARGAAGRRLRTARLASEYFVSGVLQEAVLEFVSSPAWPRHLKRARATLRERRDAMVSLVRNTLPDARLSRVPRGGFHLWVALATGLDDQALAAEARNDGLLVSAGSHWFPAEAPGAFLRLSYCALSPQDMAEGIQRLAGVLGRR